MTTWDNSPKTPGGGGGGGIGTWDDATVMWNDPVVQWNGAGAGGSSGTVWVNNQKS